MSTTTGMVGRLAARLRRRGFRVRAQRDASATKALLLDSLGPADSVVDIGAHRGAFLDQVLMVAPEGDHVAVEAIPDLVEELRRDYPSVHVVQAALSDRSGRSTFHVYRNRPAWSGLRAQEVPGSPAAEVIEVPLARLDDVMVRLAGPFRLVKIDVEGAELGVLRGGRGFLAETPEVILFEHAVTHASAYDTDATDVHDELTSLGFMVRSLKDGRALDRGAFVTVCRAAHRQRYGWRAETNFVAVRR